MSGAVIAGTTASAAAAAKKKRMNFEEEKLTKYNNNDLEGWEFKIVRAHTRKFKNDQAVRDICDEEVQAGWELVEKFDDYRLRFKRRTENRNRDQHLQIDAYRTHIGVGEGQIVAIVLGALALAGLIVFALVTLFK